MRALNLDCLSAVNGGNEGEFYEAEPIADSPVAEAAVTDAAIEPEYQPEPEFQPEPEYRPEPEYQHVAEHQTSSQERWNEPQLSASTSDDDLRRAAEDYFRTPAHERLMQDIELARADYDRNLGRAFDSIESRDRVNYDRTNP